MTCLYMRRNFCCIFSFGGKNELTGALIDSNSIFAPIPISEVFYILISVFAIATAIKDTKELLKQMLKTYIVFVKILK